jgi:hypothetical protein
LYLIQQIASDDETQKHGLVLTFMILKDFTSVNDSSSTTATTTAASDPATTTRWKMMASVLTVNRIFQCAPVRVGVIHICTPMT